MSHIPGHPVFEPEVFTPASRKPSQPQPGSAPQPAITQLAPQRKPTDVQGTKATTAPATSSTPSSGITSGDLGAGFFKLFTLAAANQPRGGSPGLPGGGAARSGGVQAVNPGQLPQRPQAVPPLGAFIRGAV